ncbi:hypothetical protein OAE75_01750, partial [bacterium]|nr:hypothetical protein [bacterium]
MQLTAVVNSTFEVFKKDENRFSGKCGGILFVLKLILGLALAPLATGDTVTFTGGTATIANGPPVITDGQKLYNNVVKYQEGDVVVTYLSPNEAWGSQNIGEYYGN